MSIDIDKEHAAYVAWLTGFHDPLQEGITSWMGWEAAKRHAAKVAEECTLCNGTGATAQWQGLDCKCPNCDGSKVEDAPSGARKCAQVPD